MFANVDFAQVRVLARFGIKNEFRINSLKVRGGKRKSTVWWLFWTLFSYVLIGGMLGAVYIKNHSPETFLATSALISLYTMFITASNIFIAFGTGFLSPTETDVLSPFPITSETFYFSRMAILLLYSLIASSCIAIGPMVAVAFFGELHLIAPVALLVMSSLSAFVASMVIITLYGILLTKLPHARLQKTFGYVQFLGGLIITFSMVMLPQIVRRFDLSGWTISSKPWVLYLPPYWFASVVDFANGFSSSHDGALLTTAIVCTLVFSLASYQILAKRYRAALEELTSTGIEAVKASLPARTVRRGKSRGLVSSLGSVVLRTPESRAVFLLLRSQFKFDTKFRLSILSWLPLMGVYFFLAVYQKNIYDPFGAHGLRTMQSSWLYMFAMMSPILIMVQISQSEAYKASWIFYAMPIDRSNLLLGVRNIVLSVIFIPFMSLLALAFSFYMPLASALEHTLMISVLSVTMFEVSFLVAPRMPFSQQRKQQRNSAARVIMLSFAIVIPAFLLALVIYFGYRDQVRYWASFAMVITIAAITDRFVRERLRKKLELQEFEG